MHLAIGTDLVYIPRFDKWATYSYEQLATIFTAAELNAAEARGDKQTTFLASRFAIKEAFYKALSQLCESDMKYQPFGLRTIARFVEVSPSISWGCPLLRFHRQAFESITGFNLPLFMASVSISHEKEYAIAQVILTRA